MVEDLSIQRLLLIVMVFITGCSGTADKPAKSHDGPKWNLKERLAEYRSLVEIARNSSRRIVDDYAPGSTILIDDHRQSISAFLAELRGIESVDETEIDSPSRRLVHLVDRSLPTKEQFLVCLRSLADGGVSTDQRDALYQDYVQQIALKHIEQLTILKCLVKHHGLRRVVVWQVADQAQPLFEIEGLHVDVRRWDRTGDPVVKVTNGQDRICLPEPSEDLDRELREILDGPDFCFLIADVEDLSGRVHRLTDGKCQYIRITTMWGERTSPLDPNVWGR